MGKKQMTLLLVGIIMLSFLMHTTVYSENKVNKEKKFENIIHIDLSGLDEGLKNLKVNLQGLEESLKGLTFLKNMKVDIDLDGLDQLKNFKVDLSGLKELKNLKNLKIDLSSLKDLKNLKCLENLDFLIDLDIDLD